MRNLCIFLIMLGVFCLGLSVAILLQVVPPVAPPVFFFPAVMLMIFVNRDFVERSGRLCLPDASLGKFLRVLRAATLVFAVTVFLSGMFLHSDPPIRPAGDGTYVGKSGKTRSTEADYKSFLGWESALFTSWASMVYLALGVEMALGTQKSQIAKRRKGH